MASFQPGSDPYRRLRARRCTAYGRADAGGYRQCPETHSLEPLDYQCAPHDMNDGNDPAGLSATLANRADF